MKILMVLTSHEQPGDTDRKTGFWLEEFAARYYVFRDTAAVTPASAAGGQAPVDPRSEEPQNHTPTTIRTRSVMGPCRRSAVDRLARNDLRGRQTPGGALPWSRRPPQHSNAGRCPARQGQVGDPLPQHRGGGSRADACRSVRGGGFADRGWRRLFEDAEPGTVRSGRWTDHRSEPRPVGARGGALVSILSSLD
jgi:hypothetical protein